MRYSHYLRTPFTELSSRSLGSSNLDSNNGPAPKQGADNSNTRLGGLNPHFYFFKIDDSDLSAAALVGLSLLFCIYLYILFRPIIKDKNCVAPYDSSRNQDTAVTEDLEKGISRLKSDVGGEDRPEADIAAHLEKRQLRQWLHRASRGRFFSDSKTTKEPTQDNRGKSNKRARRDRNRFRMPTICVSPPPPVYGSAGIKADPICYLSDSHCDNHKPQESNREKTLVQRPTDALLAPTAAARPKPKHRSLVQSSASGNIKDTNAARIVHTRNRLNNSRSGKTRTLLSRSSTM